MRTTIDLPEDLLARAKEQAARDRHRLSDVVANALRKALDGPSPVAEPREPFEIEPLDLGPAAPGIDLNDPAFYKNMLEQDDLDRYGPDAKH